MEVKEERGEDDEGGWLVGTETEKTPGDAADEEGGRIRSGKRIGSKVEERLVVALRKMVPR